MLIATYVKREGTLVKRVQLRTHVVKRVLTVNTFTALHAVNVLTVSDKV